MSSTPATPTTTPAASGNRHVTREHTATLTEGWAAGVAGDPTMPAWDTPDGEDGRGRWFTVVGSYYSSRLLWPTRDGAEARADDLRARMVDPERITVAYVRRASQTAFWTVPEPRSVTAD